MHIFKTWMRAATADEQELLARRAGTTRAYLYFLSNGDKDYGRSPGQDLAIAIERETLAMHKASGGRLPEIYRTDLNPACAQCQFALKCLGAKAVRAEFEIVTPEMLEGESEGGDAD